MDLWTALFTVFRRWYVSLPIAILAVVGMVVIGDHIAQEYEARASVVLVPPTGRNINGVQQRPDNPLDAKTAATATAKQVDTASTQRRFEDEGLSPDYKLNLDRDTAIIEFVVTGSSEEQALQTAQRLIDESKTNLARIQQIAGAADDAMITLNTVDLSDEAEPIKGDRLRVQATVLLLGLVAAVSAAFIVESFQARRAGRRPGGVGGVAATPGAGIPVLTGYPNLAQIPPGYVPLMAVPAANGGAELAPLAAAPLTPADRAAAHHGLSVTGQTPESELYGSLDELLDVPAATALVMEEPSAVEAAPAIAPQRPPGPHTNGSADRFVNAGKRTRTRQPARIDGNADPAVAVDDAVIDLTTTKGRRRNGSPGSEARLHNDPTPPPDADEPRPVVEAHRAETSDTGAKEQPVAQEAVAQETVAVDAPLETEPVRPEPPLSEAPLSEPSNETEDSPPAHPDATPEPEPVVAANRAAPRSARSPRPSVDADPAVPSPERPTPAKRQRPARTGAKERRSSLFSPGADRSGTDENN